MVFIVQCVDMDVICSLPMRFGQPHVKIMKTHGDLCFVPLFCITAALQNDGSMIFLVLLIDQDMRYNTKALLFDFTIESCELMRIHLKSARSDFDLVPLTVMGGGVGFIDCS